MTTRYIDETPFSACKCHSEDKTAVWSIEVEYASSIEPVALRIALNCDRPDLKKYRNLTRNPLTDLTPSPLSLFNSANIFWPGRCGNAHKRAALGLPPWLCATPCVPLFVALKPLQLVTGGVSSSRLCTPAFSRRQSCTTVGRDRPSPSGRVGPHPLGEQLQASWLTGPDICRKFLHVL